MTYCAVGTESAGIVTVTTSIVVRCDITRGDIIYKPTENGEYILAK